MCFRRHRKGQLARTENTDLYEATDIHRITCVGPVVDGKTGNIVESSPLADAVLATELHACNIEPAAVSRSAERAEIGWDGVAAWVLDLELAQKGVFRKIVGYL